jgi:hypothetical protein
MNSLDYLPHIKKHLVDEGTLFKKHYCTIALCCPSRVSLWTGKAAHNTVRRLYSLSIANGEAHGFSERHRCQPAVWWLPKVRSAWLQ